jgi:DNA-binding SARP family transcriptional activator/TolB-like protein/tetratricopeptide (TPR) repeat protein
VSSGLFSLTTLGELRLFGSEGSLLSGRRKELVLLVYIARHAPKGVLRDELAALLWGEREEDKARQSLRHALHQLRRALGDAIEVTAESVRVGDGMIGVDASQLEADIASGELARGVERWGGEFLRGAEDVGGEEYRAWLEREREALRRATASGLAGLAEQARASGRLDEEIDWARRWTKLLPYDESAHARLIDALHRRGDAAEARAVYATFVDFLKSDLGAPPSVELIRLGQQINRPSSQERERRAGTGAIFTPALVGRAAAIAASLSELWSRVSAEGNGVVLEGERGTGKTRLSSELVRVVRASSPGAIVLEANGRDDARESQWSTLRRLTTALVTSSAIEDAPNKTLIELSSLLPALRDRFPHLGQPTGGIRRSEAAFRDVLRILAVSSPMLLVIDDIDQADAQSYELLRSLLAAVPRGVMIVATSSADSGAARATELAEIAGVRRFKVTSLQPNDVATLVDSMLEIAAADRDVVAESVTRQTGGNPQRVTAAVSRMAGSGELALDDRGVWRLAAPSPARVQRGPRRAWVVGVGLAVLFLAATVPLVRGRDSSGRATDPDSAARIAVLDLELLAPDTLDKYLSSGLAEEINSSLSRFGDLRIKSRGAVRSVLASGVTDPIQLGRALHVDYLVEGSVRHLGQSLKVAIQLTKTSDGFQLWRKDFDSPTSALPALHDRIAREVASKVGSRLTRGDSVFRRRPLTTDAVAYEHYLRGNYYLARRTPPTVAQAIAQYRIAAARDSSFAAAKARIAYSYSLLLDWGWAYAGRSTDQLLHEGLELTDNALRLDSLSTDAWMARAYLLATADPVHMAGAAEAFEHAIALDPRNTEAIHQYGQVHEALGNWDAAMEAFRRTLLLEPDRSLPYVAMASIAWKRGSPAMARRLYDSALVIDPGASYILSSRALLRLVAQSEVNGGLQDAETAVHVEDGYSIPPHAVLAVALAKSGSVERAKLEVDRALSEIPDPSAPSPTDARFISSALLAVGRREEALRLLERARPRGAWLWFYCLAPDFEPIRNDPRFVRMMQDAHPPASLPGKS